MSNAVEIRIAFASLAEAMHRLKALAGCAASLPTLNPPGLERAPSLFQAFDQLVHRTDLLQARVEGDLTQLGRAVEQILYRFATTDLGLAQLALGDDRHIGLEQGG